MWIYDESVDEGDAGDVLSTDDWGTWSLPGSRILWVYWRDYESRPGTSPEAMVYVKVTGVTATRCVDFDHYGCDEVQIVDRTKPLVYGTAFDAPSATRDWGLGVVPLEVVGQSALLGILGDDVKEEDETFRVELTPVAGDGIHTRTNSVIPACGRCSATITIRNDD